MERKLSWYEAIKTRTSRRTFMKSPLDPNQLESIRQINENINNESGLHFQLLEDASQFLNGLKKSYGMFKNVPTIIALVGDATIPNSKVHVGYYGEFLMLECVSLNLGTCWIGGTYNKKALKNVLDIKDNEELFAVIAVGKVETEKALKEKLLSRIGKNKQTFDQLLLEKEEPLPSWVFSGIEAARLAPSALNGKPVGYSYLKQTVSAFVTKKKYSFEYMDLGISLAHFELGALHEGVQGKWTPKNETDENVSFVFTPKY